MSQRLQVLMDEKELREIRKLAKREQMTVAEWVRKALRDARKRSPTSSRRAKRAAIEAATAQSFPTGDIERMLEEIEQGYGSGGDE